MEGVTYINPSMYKNDGVIRASNEKSGWILIKAKGAGEKSRPNIV